MKGCLKLPSRASSPTPHHCHHCPKHVVFDADGSEQIFFADEWDRTPAEPARNLSYSDLLELKQIQRSLPRAIQPADVTGSSHFLCTVPIGLLPLLPESDPASARSPSSAASTASFPLNSWRTVRTPTPAVPRAQIPPHPIHLSHLPPARPPLHRAKSRFAFLPLLGTDSGPPPRTPSPPYSPPPSERSSSPDYLLSDTASDVSHDPPTPALTNASLNNSPLSRPSSCSPEPPAFQLPLSKNRGHWHDLIASDDYLPSSRLSSAHSSCESLVHDPYDYRRPGYGASSKAYVAQPIPIPKPPSTPRKPKKEKKNVIVINGIEIELDDDNQQQDDDDESGSDSELEEEEEGSTPPARPTVSIPQRHQIPSPTLTTARPLSSTPPSPTVSLHAPLRFKRTSNASTASVSSSPPVTKQTCSPPRNAGTARSSPLMVPSA